jgi:hypothetical protein
VILHFYLQVFATILVVNNEAVSLVVSRQVVAEVIARLIDDKSSANHSAVLDIGNRLLALVQPRIISYEEQVIIATTFEMDLFICRRQQFVNTWPLY